MKGGRRSVRPQLYLAVYGMIAFFLIAAHGLLLGTPYFWDEIGQFIPASLDLFHSGWWIAHSTVPNVHPPGLMAYLAFFWKLFGYSIAGTRVAMLLFAALGALATFLLAIELGRGLPGAPAFTALGLLCMSPLFFAQSMLAQLDMPAMCLTALALLLFLQDRVRASAAVCVALVLVKETGIAAPALFGCWLLFERRWRSALWFALPALALAVWLVVLKRATGHWTGNAEFARYNLVDTLNPVRFGLALLRRFYYLFVSTGHFIGSAACVWAFGRMPALRSRAWRVSAAFVAVHAVTVSLFGGAVLERYLLPALPILYSAFAICLWALMPRMRLATLGALIACLVVANFVNPPYPFPLENNLAFLDFVNLEMKAALAVDGMPGSLATSFPMADAFRRADYGYVWRTRKVRTVANFRPESVGKLTSNPPDLMIVYDATWDPLGLMARVPGYRPPMTAAEIGRLLDMRVARHWERGGMGMALLVRHQGSGGLRVRRQALKLRPGWTRTLGQEEILGFMGLADRAPVEECIAGDINLSLSVFSPPLDAVIREVALLLEDAETVCDVLQPRAFRWASGFKELHDMAVADALHSAVVENSGEGAALAFHSPVAHGFIDRQMEQGIVNR